MRKFFNYALNNPDATLVSTKPDGTQIDTGVKVPNPLAYLNPNAVPYIKDLNLTNNGTPIENILGAKENGGDGTPRPIGGNAVDYNGAFAGVKPATPDAIVPIGMKEEVEKYEKLYPPATQQVANIPRPAARPGA